MLAPPPSPPLPSSLRGGGGPAVLLEGQGGAGGGVAGGIEEQEVAGGLQHPEGGLPSRQPLRAGGGVSIAAGGGAHTEGWNAFAKAGLGKLVSHG